MVKDKDWYILVTNENREELQDFFFKQDERYFKGKIWSTGAGYGVKNGTFCANTMINLWKNIEEISLEQLRSRFVNKTEQEIILW